MKDNDKDFSINRGEEFMRARRSRQEEPEEVEPTPEETQEAGKMNTELNDLIAVLAASVVIGGTILGFIVVWLASAYYQSFIEMVTEDQDQQEQIMQVTPHPEMMDSDGNPMPFQVAKLISVEFDPTDAFDSDPFPED